MTSWARTAVIAEELAVNALLRTDDMPAQVQAPTLIVRATRRTHAPDRGLDLPAEEPARMHGLVTGSRYLETPDANHNTLLTTPLVAREALAFLDAAGHTHPT